MIFLLLSILTSASLMIIFKLLEKYDAPIFPVIVFNYGTCLAFGLWVTPDTAQFLKAPTLPWFPFALFVGLMFILLFNLIGISTQKNGISVTAVAQKMSLAIPVIAAFIIHQEQHLNFFKLSGIICAIVAVVLSSIKPGKEKNTADEKPHPGLVILPFIIFFGSGIVDTVIDFTQSRYLEDDAQHFFITTLFGTAFLLGLIKLIFEVSVRGVRFKFRRVLFWGILLGLPNYGSIFFLIKALKHSTFEASALFPLNNVGIVMTATLAAIVIFKERLSGLNYIGIALSVIAIFLISMGK